MDRETFAQLKPGDMVAYGKRGTTRLVVKVVKNSIERTVEVRLSDGLKTVGYRAGERHAMSIVREK